MADGGQADDGKTCKTGKQSTVNGKRENQGKGKTVYRFQAFSASYCLFCMLRAAYCFFGHPSSVFRSETKEDFQWLEM